MRILQLNDYRDGGGCEVLVRRTAERLAARGLSVDVFTGQDVPGLRRTPVGYVDSLRARMVVGEKLETFDPDVVHVHNLYHLLSPGVLAAIARWRRRRGRRQGKGARVVMTAHDFHVLCPNAGARYFRDGRGELADIERVRGLWYVLRRRWDHRGRLVSGLKTIQHVWNYRIHRRRRLVDVFVCPSRFMQEALDRAGLPTTLLPNPAPPPRARTARDATPGAPIRAVFAGRVEPEKGIVELIRHWPADFPGTLLVVGDGSDLPAGRGVARERDLGDRVRFLGAQTHEETLDHLAAAHLVVVPSKVYENAPVVLLEALALGANVLVSDLGGSREIVEEAGVGYTLDAGDAGSVAAAIARIVEDHARGRLNRFDVSAFLRGRDEDAYVERLLGVYRTGT